MGRPKGSKNKPKIIGPILNFSTESCDLQLTPQETGNGLTALSEKIKKINKIYPHCERCGLEIKCEPRRIDFNILTGMADYHRATPRYLKMCNNCCQELSQIVDKWLLEGPCGEEIRKKGW